MRHLDTNIVIPVVNGDVKTRRRMQESLPDVAISTVVLAEMMFGARNAANLEQNVQRVARFVTTVSVLPFDAEAADAYSRIRLELKQKGRPCSDTDMMIAATALCHGAVLVTHNTRHFEPIDNLKLEDWLSEPK